MGKGVPAYGEMFTSDYEWSGDYDNNDYDDDDDDDCGLKGEFTLFAPTDLAFNEFLQKLGGVKVVTFHLRKAIYVFVSSIGNIIDYVLFNKKSQENVLSNWSHSLVILGIKADKFETIPRQDMKQKTQNSSVAVLRSFWHSDNADILTRHCHQYPINRPNV